MISTKDRINNVLGEIEKISQGEEIVVAFSGGLDSTVVSALAIQALGREKVEAITVSFGEYSYSKGLRNIQDISRALDLKLKIVQGKKEQERILKKGPACNKCTRIAKLGRVKKEASGRLVLTGSNQSDTWGKRGLKLYDGNISPLPEEKLKGKIIEELKKVKTLERVEFLDKPIKLIIKANKGQFDNQHSRHWLEKGRLQPDFSVPIEVEWLLTTNKSLSTFQVIDY